jgi:hypothetical protein
MAQPLTLTEGIALALVTGFVPAAIGAAATYVVARLNLKREIQRLEIQFVRQQQALEKGQIAGLRQQFINPLNYWARRLSRRLSEIEEKVTSATDPRVPVWMKALKDHMDGNKTLRDFAAWSCYEGIFATTTVYYTCSYFQAARQVRFNSPFSELDPDYARQLDAGLEKVSQALGGEAGIWDSAQEVIAERFTTGTQKIDYEAMCRTIDSHDPFRYGPFLRPIDVYIDGIGAARLTAAREALDSLLAFTSSKPTPER